MKKTLTTLVLAAAFIIGLIGSTVSVSAAESYPNVTLSTSWQNIATSTTGFNCNVTLHCLVTGTDGLGAVKPDVRMLDKNGNVVWSENKSCPGLSSRTYWCGSNVYKIQIKVSNGSGTAWASKG